jgi:FkbM family methyltransferase
MNKMNLNEIIRNSRLVHLSRRIGIESRLHDLYWTMFPLIIDERYRATVGKESAEFHISTPAERHNLRESDFLGEREIIRHLLARVRPNDVFYDIGAQFGAYSCLVSDLLETGTVVAFDPDTRRVARIETNFQLNGVEGRVLPYALSDHSGSQNFKLSTGELTDERGTEVETTMVDRLVDSGTIPEPTVIKVDVEGAELNVFRGMSATLEQSPPRLVYCEMHKQVETNNVRNLLCSHGYTVSELNGPSTFLFAEFDQEDQSEEDR